MKDFKIYNDRPELNEGELNQGKDFNKVKGQAKKWTQLKKLTYAFPIGALIITALVNFMTNDAEVKTAAKADSAIIQTAEASKENIWQEGSEIFSIDASTDTTLISSTGSIIKIPEGILLDNNGNQAKGKVEIAYKEYHNVAEIMLSKIPMTYDSAGNQYHFESAGMFEINASNEAGKVQIQQGKSIEVHLASVNGSDAKFNQYYRENRDKPWEYRQADQAIKASVKPSKEKSEPIAIQEPTKPRLQSEDRFQFTIDVDKNEFPELAEYQNVSFEVGPENTSFDPKSANKEWNDVELKRLESKDKYKITFKRFLNAIVGGKEGSNNEILEVIAYPVFTSGDFKNALKKYEKLFARYESRKEKRLTDERMKAAKLEAEIRQRDEIAKYYQKLAEKNIMISRGFKENEEVVYRTFQVMNFGIYNSDYPCSLPQGIEVLVDLSDEQGKNIKPVSMFMVEKGRNIMYALTNTASIKFNPDADNLLFVLESNNTMHVASTDEFKKIKRGDKKHTFKLSQVASGTYKESDIIKYL